MKTRIIYNPAAGPWDMTRTLKRLAAHLGKAGWATELVQTDRPGDATRHARQAADDGVPLVLVAGGDGTINEATNGLVDTATVMGIVPVGTGNILAHQLKMPILSAVAPLNVKDVGDALLEGRIQRVDTGVVNDRYFICWAGMGLDAEIAAQMEPRPRYAKRLKALPYAIAAVSVASEFRGVRSSIAIGDRTVRTRALMVIVSNIQLYAAVFHIAPHARMDDGLFDIFVFKGLGLSYVLRHLLLFFRGRHLRDPEVLHVLARHLDVETSPTVAVHLDGDPHGDTPASIRLAPATLRLLVPPQAPVTLFNEEPEERF